MIKSEVPNPIPPPAEPIIVAEAVTNGGVTKIDQGPKQKAERPDRRRVRASNREPAEIVWEPRTGVSWVFVITSIVFVIVALAIVIGAMYVR